MRFKSLRIFLAAVVIGISTLLAAAPAPAQEGGINKSELVKYEGFVCGLDVVLTPTRTGQSLKCFAFINRERPPGQEEIKVLTSEPLLQSALETATLKGARVEVTYIERGNFNILMRVRIL